MLATALLPLLLPSAGAPTEPAPLARDYLLALTPGDAMAALVLDDLGETRAALEESAWLRFARDEQVAGLVQHLWPSLEQELGKALDLGWFEQMGLDPRALLGAVSGSAVLFVEVPGHDPDDMVGGLLVELGEDRAPFDELLNKLLDQARQGASVHGAEHAGVSLTIVEAHEAKGGTAILAELGDVVAVVGGANRDHAGRRAREIVERWAGEAEGASLLENETYRSSREHSDFVPQVEAFVNLDAFWDLLEKSGELAQADVPPELFAELRRLSWVRVAGRLAAEEVADLEVALGAPAEGLLGAFASLLGGVPSDLVERIPRNATAVSTLSLDLAGAGALAEDLARAFDAEAYEGLQAGLAVTEGMGVDVREEVLGQLTGEVAAFSVEVPARESLFGAAGGILRGIQGASPIPTYGQVLMLGVRDAESIEELLAGLTETSSAAVGTDDVQETWPREVHGRTVHRLEVFQGFLPVGVHWSATPGALLVSLQPTALGEALRMSAEDGTSIRSNRAFSEILKENRRASLLRVCDSAACLKSRLGALQSLGPVLKVLSAVSGKPIDTYVPVGVDTPWPDAAVVDRYFGGVMYASFSWWDGALRAHIASR
jgi:hypothetical protein